MIDAAAGHTLGLVQACRHECLRTRFARDDTMNHSQDDGDELHDERRRRIPISGVHSRLGCLFCVDERLSLLTIERVGRVSSYLRAGSKKCAARGGWYEGVAD